jgi:hypothetical protein
LNNCIVWGNIASASGSPGNQFFIDQGTITLNYSCYSNSTGDVYLSGGGVLIATNNDITGNPLFINEADSDFRIYGNSSCVNSGNNSYNSGSIDIRGQARIQNTTIDRGAYEWTAGVDPTTATFIWTGSVSADWNTPGNWTYITVPGPSDDVYIPDTANDPVVNEPPSSPASCQNLTIKAAAGLTVLQDKALVVYGNYTVIP